MTPVRTLHKARLVVARRARLSFPEPFFWTTSDIERLSRLDSAVFIVSHDVELASRRSKAR